MHLEERHNAIFVKLCRFNSLIGNLINKKFLQSLCRTHSGNKVPKMVDFPDPCFFPKDGQRSLLYLMVNDRVIVLKAVKCWWLQR